MIRKRHRYDMKLTLRWCWVSTTLAVADEVACVLNRKVAEEYLRMLSAAYADRLSKLVGAYKKPAGATPPPDTWSVVSS